MMDWTPPPPLACSLTPIHAPTPRTVDDFRKDSLRELKKIKLAWPDLHYATAKGVLILYPSKPAIPPALTQHEHG